MYALNMLIAANKFQITIKAVPSIAEYTKTTVFNRDNRFIAIK